MLPSPAAPTPGVDQPLESSAAIKREAPSRTLAFIFAIRLAAGTALLCIAALWTFVRNIELGFILIPMLGYIAIAGLSFANRRRPVAQHLALIMPFLDVSLAFVVHWHGITTFPQFFSAWALSSLGVFSIIVTLVGLSLRVRMVVITTLLAIAAQWPLLQAPSVTVYSVLVATFSLAFVGIATSVVPRLTAAALRREQEAIAARDSLLIAQDHNRGLELLQREKDALLEIIVHDMRSPVGAAMLSIEYLALELKRQQPRQAPLLEATEDALSTLNNLTSMISQTLDTSKLENGRITMRMDRAELKPILEAVRREALPRAASRSIAIEMEAPDGLEAALDLRLFPRALEALISHLLRRTPEGSKMLIAATRGNGELRVSLHSNAPSVPEDEREKIFDKFPFVEGEARRISGWGLGLYFARLVMSAHQGNLGLEEIDGWTTSFVARLPALSKTS